MGGGDGARADAPARALPRADDEGGGGGALPPRALTYRDVRKEARRLADRLAHDFSRGTREAYSEASSEQMHFRLDRALLNREEERVVADKAAAREYANFLVSCATLAEHGADERR